MAFPEDMSHCGQVRGHLYAESCPSVPRGNPIHSGRCALRCGPGARAACLQFPCSDGHILPSVINTPTDTHRRTAFRIMALRTAACRRNDSLKATFIIVK